MITPDKEFKCHSRYDWKALVASRERSNSTVVRIIKQK